MKDTSITILGTEYIIKVGNKEKYPILDDCDGYTDTTIKLIVIDSMEEGDMRDGEDGRVHVKFSVR